MLIFAVIMGSVADMIANGNEFKVTFSILISLFSQFQLEKTNSFQSYVEMLSDGLKDYMKYR